MGDQHEYSKTLKKLKDLDSVISRHEDDFLVGTYRVAYDRHIQQEDHKGSIVARLRMYYRALSLERTQEQAELGLISIINLYCSREKEQKDAGAELELRRFLFDNIAYVISGEKIPGLDESALDTRKYRPKDGENTTK